MKPVGYMLRETRGKSTKVLCGEVFMRKESADAAAARKTGHWRTVDVVPVYEAAPVMPPSPPPGWRCFHCAAEFTSIAQAALHFGTREDQTPACQLKASEGGLIRAIREAEDEVERVHTQLHAESADGLRALQNNLGRHRTALIAAEESGYERGLADAAPDAATFEMVCAGAAAFAAADDDEKFTKVWAAMRAVARGLKA